MIKESKQSSICSVSCQSNEVPEQLIKKYLAQGPEAILLPFNDGVHFTVAIVNVRELKFLFFDPLGEENGEIHFRKFTSIIADTDGKWSFERPECNHQTDSYSYGIFVLQYVFRFLSNRCYTNLTRVEEFRKFVATLLVRNGSVNNFYFRCGSCRIRNEKKCKECVHECAVEIA